MVLAAGVAVHAVPEGARILAGIVETKTPRHLAGVLCANRACGQLFLRRLILRNGPAYAGKGERQMVLAAINTAFTQESFETASQQWRAVPDQLRAKFPNRRHSP